MHSSLFWGLENLIAAMLNMALFLYNAERRPILSGLNAFAAGIGVAAAAVVLTLARSN